VPEVCIAIADEQRAGRGRNGRTWQAPPGSSLLLSVGFRPAWLEPVHAWRLAAIVSLAMAGAAEAAAGLAAGTVRLKWPNDLVALDAPEPDARDLGPGKLAGVLGETRGIGGDRPEAVIGIGVNVSWQGELPTGLATRMTTLSGLAGPVVSREELSAAFLERLGPMVEGLRAGTFPDAEWRSRQVTQGAEVRLELPDGSAEHVRAVDVDANSGALVVEPLAGAGPRRSVTVGEIQHVRLAGV
jgi:BirA family biotin operon repressor/biotin-[acetyl-CoA-carboxylase] ligase